MPAKYSIHTKAFASPLSPRGKAGDRRLARGLFELPQLCEAELRVRPLSRRTGYVATRPGYLDYIYQCKGCLNCIQNCTKNILRRVANPEFPHLGDAYYTPDIILATWFQAETGRIPVSGCRLRRTFQRFRVRFHVDRHVEIVRPTCDGIHGREYIHTGVDIGRKVARWTSRRGSPDVVPPPLVESPLPVIFDLVPPHSRRGPVVAAILRAAAEIGTLAVVRPEGIPAGLTLEQEHIIPLLENGGEPGSARGDGDDSGW